MARAVGTTEIIDTPSGAFNGPGGGLQTAGLKVEILSPTQQMVNDFGVNRAYLNGSNSSTKEKVLPNDNLMYRDTRQINGVNVQDANLLKIRVTYLYETRMPLTRYFFTPLMNANLTRVLFQNSPAGNTADAPGGWRIPLVAYATVRMQSDFKAASLSAAGTPGTSGGGSGTGTGGTDTGSGGAGDTGESDDEVLCP